MRLGKIISLGDLDSSISNTEEDLFRAVRKFSPADLILRLAVVNVFLTEEYNQPSGNREKELIEHFIPDELKPKIYPLIEKGAKFLSRHKLLALMKICLENPKSLSTENTVAQNDPKAFGLLLLRIGDHLDKDFERQLAWTKGKKNKTQKHLATTLFTRLQYFSKTPLLWQALPRYWIIYKDCFTRIKKYWPKEKPIDFPKVFKEALNEELDSFIALSYSIFGWYADSNALMKRKPDEFALGFTYFRNMLPSAAESGKRIFAKFSSKMEMFEEQLRSLTKTRGTNYYNISPIWNTPLLCNVVAEINNYIPLDITFLYEKFTSGLYWQLHDALLQKEQQGDGIAKKLRSQLSISFGRAFEIYVLDLIRRVYSNPKNGLSRYWSQTEGSLPKEGADFVIQAGHALLVAEITKEYLPHPVLIEIDPVKFISALRKLLVGEDGKSGKVQQILKTISDVEKSKLTLEGVEISKIKEIYPILLIPA